MQKVGKQKTVKGYLNAGNKLRKEGKFDQAIEQYQQLLKLNPNSVPALKNLATIYEAQKGISQALDYHQKVAQLRPNDVETKVSVARIMIERARFDIAFEQIEQALKIKPNYSLAIRLTIKLARGKHPVAQKAKTQLLSLIKNSSSLFYRQTFIQLTENLEVALHLLHISPREVVQILKEKNNKSKQDLALIKLCEGMICKRRGKYSQALEKFKESDLAKPAYIIPCLKVLGRQKEIEKLINNCLAQSSKFALIKEFILSKLEIDYEDKLLLFIDKDNIGDACGQLSNIKSVCEFHQAKALVFYRAGGAAETLGKMFLEPLVPDYVAAHLPIDSSIWNMLQKRKPKEPELIPLNEIPIGKGRPRLLILGNPLEKPVDNSSRSKPEIDSGSQASAIAKFEELRLKPQATVLIAPFSNHYNLMTGADLILSDFWLSLFEILHSKGLSIAINARNHQSLLGYSWLKSSNIPLSFADLSLTELIPFVNYSGYFISIVTGLCELLCFTNKNVRRGCIHLVKNDPGVVVNCQSPVRKPSPILHVQFPHTQFTTSDSFLHYGIKLGRESGLTINEQISNFVYLYFEKGK